jgi:hypothetical protein
VIHFRVDRFDRLVMYGQERFERVHAMEEINKNGGAFWLGFPRRPLPTLGDEKSTRELLFYA